VIGIEEVAGTRHFLLLGAGEFLPWSEEAERNVLRTTRRTGPIGILPTASAPEGDAVFGRWGRMGLDHYAQLGLDARVVPLKTRDDALDPALIAMLDDVTMVFFSGGNPAYLARTLDGTPFLDALVRGLASGMVFAGCSARCDGRRCTRRDNDRSGVPVGRFGADRARSVRCALEPRARVARREAIHDRRQRPS
jgi:hypothetical protein